MKDKINTYFAILIVTLFGAGATMIIVHVAFSSTIVAVYGNQTVLYTYLP
jgi:hypothetical protein